MRIWVSKPGAELPVDCRIGQGFWLNIEGIVNAECKKYGWVVERIEELAPVQVQLVAYCRKDEDT